jgi:GGDEF domain-containing protein
MLVRPEDLLARIGGDEFAVLIDEGLDDDGLTALIDRLAAAATGPHETSAGPVPCGFCVGVARARPDELSYELLGRADADLYARKAGSSAGGRIPSTA